jgi:polyamine oxidase
MAAFNVIFIKFNKYLDIWKNEIYLYADTKRGYYPYWHNFSLDKFYGKKSNIFGLIISGDEAIRSEITDKEIIKKEIETVANKMFKGNNLSITDIYIPKWFSNPLYCGSFSNCPVGFTSKEFKLLQKPIKNLYFATNDFN